jgi:RNA polymerase sigma factor (sigma-70 family)
VNDAEFGAFFERRYTGACRFAAGMVGPDGAEDAAQDAFYKFYLVRGRLRAEADPAPYFYKILARTCLKVHRRRRLWAAVCHLLPVRKGRETADPERAATVFRSFSPRERAVFVLTEFRDFSDAEAARALGMAEATLRVHRHRARQKILRWEEESHAASL